MVKPRIIQAIMAKTKITMMAKTRLAVDISFYGGIPPGEHHHGPRRQVCQIKEALPQINADRARNLGQAWGPLIRAHPRNRGKDFCNLPQPQTRANDGRPAFDAAAFAVGPVTEMGLEGESGINHQVERLLAPE